jgi:hypothetical protein
LFSLSLDLDEDISRTTSKIPSILLISSSSFRDNGKILQIPNEYTEFDFLSNFHPIKRFYQNLVSTYNRKRKGSEIGMSTEHAAPVLDDLFRSII